MRLICRYLGSGPASPSHPALELEDEILYIAQTETPTGIPPC